MAVKMGSMKMRRPRTSRSPSNGIVGSINRIQLKIDSTVTTMMNTS